MTIVDRKQCLEDFERDQIHLKNEYHKLTFDRRKFEPIIITKKTGIKVLKIFAKENLFENKIEIYTPEEMKESVCEKLRSSF